MIIRILLFSALLFSLTASAHADAISSAQKVYGSVNEAVVMIFDVKNNDVKQTIDYGSGVAVGKHVIATNCHVALKGDARLIKVNDKFVTTTLIYKDELNDICLLNVADHEFKPVKSRPASSVKIGEEVYAIGSPRGYEKTISRGIISNRIKFKETYILQTDAATSPGSSGGGLFDIQGRLIGITFAKNEALGSEGIGFAIPVEMVDLAMKTLATS
jgi:serine protease Do